MFSESNTLVKICFLKSLRLWRACDTSIWSDRKFWISDKIKSFVKVYGVVNFRSSSKLFLLTFKDLKLCLKIQFHIMGKLFLTIANLSLSDVVYSLIQSRFQDRFYFRFGFFLFCAFTLNFFLRFLESVCFFNKCRCFTFLMIFRWYLNEKFNQHWIKIK